MKCCESCDEYFCSGCAKDNFPTKESKKCKGCE
jgi:hypothetical protein